MRQGAWPGEGGAGTGSLCWQERLLFRTERSEGEGEREGHATEDLGLRISRDPRTREVLARG